MMSNRRSGRIALALWKWALLERCVDRKPRLKETRETIALSPVERRKGLRTFTPQRAMRQALKAQPRRSRGGGRRTSSLVVGRESTAARTWELRLPGTAPALPPLWVRTSQLFAPCTLRSRRWAQFRAFMQTCHSERLTTCIRCWASRAALTSL